jgi:chemotaxis signal transduction protein
LEAGRGRIDILAPGQGEISIDTSDSPTAEQQEGRGGQGGDTPSGSGGYPLLVVRSSDVRAGIPVSRVREVVPLRRLARIPDGKPPFRGLLSMRGEIVTVLDLGELRRAAEAGTGPERFDTTAGVTTGSIRPNRMDSVVVLRGGRDPLGLEVDGVEDIRDFPPMPATGPDAGGGAGRLWAGMVRDDRGEVGVLDADGVFAIMERLAGEQQEPPSLEVAHG